MVFLLFQCLYFAESDCNRMSQAHRGPITSWLPLGASFNMVSALLTLTVNTRIGANAHVARQTPSPSLSRTVTSTNPPTSAFSHLVFYTYLPPTTNLFYTHTLAPSQWSFNLWK